MNIKNNKDDTSDEKPIVIRNTTDLQRLKLEKLMKNPDKPVLIPERPKGRSMPPVPDFVRNVMGSSAGAGSGEFHVYRHLRRKEYARQKFIQEKSEREKMDDDYHYKLEENKRTLQEKTAKNRAKRQKRKMKAKENRKKKIKKEETSSESSELNETDEENSCGDEKEDIEIVKNKDVENKKDEQSKNNDSLTKPTLENITLNPSNLNDQDVIQEVSKTAPLNETVHETTKENDDSSNSNDSISIENKNVDTEK